MQHHYRISLFVLPKARCNGCHVAVASSNLRMAHVDVIYIKPFVPQDQFTSRPFVTSIAQSATQSKSAAAISNAHAAIVACSHAHFILIYNSACIFPYRPDLMPSLGVILSEFPDEPYVAENYNDEAIRR